MKYIIVFILNFLVLSSALGQETTPKYFYTSKLSNCVLKENTMEVSISNFNTKKSIKGVIGFDWEKYHSENSNSLTVKHDLISDPIMKLNSSIHNAVVKNNLEEIKIGVDLLYQIAEKNTLLNTPTVSDIEKLGSICYGGNKNAKAKCEWHKPQWAMIFAAHYIISSIYVKEFLSKEQHNKINSYIDILFTRYISPWSNKEGGKGYNEMANGKIASIAYANWKDDYQLGKDYFKKGFSEIESHFRDDGYISNNSFRGVRAVWYHSLGLNSALGLIALSNAWNIDVPEKVLNKIKKSAEILNVGITDYKKFKSKQFFGKNQNSSLNPKYARKHTHQNAISIDFLMSKYLGINLANDYKWVRKKLNLHNDLIIGFNASCLFVSKL